MYNKTYYLFILLSYTLLVLFGCLSHLNIDFVILTFILFLLLIIYFFGTELDIVKYITSIFISISLSIVILDVLLRLDLISKPIVRPFEALHEISEEFPDQPRYNPNSIFKGFTYGDLASSIKNKRYVEYQIDKYGFRNIPNPNNEPVDLIIIGDSYGVGESITQDKTWHYMLSKDKNLRLENLSVGGATPSMEVKILESQLSRIKYKKESKILWLLYTGNDLVNIKTLLTEKSIQNNYTQKIIQKINNFRYHSPVSFFLSRLFKREEKQDNFIYKEYSESLNSELLYFYKKEQFQISYEDTKKFESVEIIKKVIDKFLAITKDLNLETYILLLPDKYEIHGNEQINMVSSLSKILNEYLIDKNVQFLDAKDKFKKESLENTKLLYWTDDTHLNEEGNIVLNNYITENIIDKIK